MRGWAKCLCRAGGSPSEAYGDTKALLDDKYGKCKVGSRDEKAIKKLYEELNLEQQHKAYEEQAYAEIMALKPTVKEVPWEVFEVFLNKIFKRSK